MTITTIIALMVMCGIIVTIINLGLYLDTVKLSKSKVIGVYKPVNKLNHFISLVRWLVFTVFLTIIYNLVCLM